jgi:hypothetical protein
MAMEFIKRLVKRIGAILLAPEAEWSVVAGEQSSALLLPYVAILSLVPAAARAIGASLVGAYAPLVPSLAGALIIYLSGFVIVHVLAFLVDALAPRFAGRKDFSRALALTAYAATPIWLAGIFLAVPGLSFLAIFGLYALYLVWSGVPVLMRAPPDRVFAYTAAIVVGALVAVVIASAIATPFFAPTIPAPSR